VQLGFRSRVEHIQALRCFWCRVRRRLGRRCDISKWQSSVGSLTSNCREASVGKARPSPSLTDGSLDLGGTLLRSAGGLDGGGVVGRCLGVPSSEMVSSRSLAVLATWATSSPSSPMWPASEWRYLDKDPLKNSRVSSDRRAKGLRSKAVCSRKSSISNGRSLIWTWPLAACCQRSIIPYLFIVSKNPGIRTVYIVRSGCR
jgi:hypothetical protein